MPQGLSQAVLLSTTLTLSLLLPQELWPSASPLLSKEGPGECPALAQQWDPARAEENSLRACEGQEWENRAQDSRGAAQTAPGIGQWAAPVAPLGSRAVAVPQPSWQGEQWLPEEPREGCKDPCPLSVSTRSCSPGQEPSSLQGHSCPVLS